MLACEGVHPLVCDLVGVGTAEDGGLLFFPQSQAPGSWGCQGPDHRWRMYASLSKESALQPGGLSRLEKSELL